MIKEDKEFVHCATNGWGKVKGWGKLDPSKSALDRLRTNDPNEMRYNCFLYAFSRAADGGLEKVHKMSQWAAPGNYAYVFNGKGRRYMSDRCPTDKVEVGFLDDIPWDDLTVYKVGKGHVLTPI